MPLADWAEYQSLKDVINSTRQAVNGVQTLSAREMPLPTDLGLSRLPSFKVFKVGDRYETDLDIQALRPVAGTTYWVSTTGLTGNVGSFASPTTMASALAKPDVGTIVFMPGEYFRAQGFGTTIEKNVNLVAYGPGVKITGWETPSALTWTLESGNIYKTTRSATQVVADTRSSRRTAWFDYPMYALKSDLASITGPGQWAIVGSTVYVWALGNSNLITDSSFMRLAIDVAGAGIRVRGNNRVYVEGIDVEGAGNSSGGGFGALAFGGSGGVPQIIAKDCSIRYTSWNGFTLTGADWGIFVNCVSSSVVRDCFNYHSGTFNGNAIPSEFLEIDCLAYRAGITQSELALPDETNNGTTAHDLCKGVRLNGLYREAYGPIMADVLGAKTWNLGCTADGSLAPNRGWGFNTGDAGTQCWYEDCKNYNNAVAMQSASNSFLYYRAIRFDRNVLMSQVDSGSQILRY